MKAYCLNIFPVSILLGLSSVILAETNVYLINSTPYIFDISMQQTGDATLRIGKDYAQHVTRINAWQAKTKIASFSRNVGIKKNKFYQFMLHLTTAQLPSEVLTLKQQLQGKAIGSTLYVGFDSKGSISDWTTSKTGRWQDPIFVTCKDAAGVPQTLMIRYRMYEAGSYNDIEYVISFKPEPDKNVLYTTPDTAQEPCQLNLLSWNLYLLTVEPLGITFYSKPKVMERAKRVAEAIGSSYDVLMLCEVFDDDARKVVLEGLKDKGYKYSTCILGQGLALPGRGMEESIDQPFVVHFNDSRFGSDTHYTIGGTGRGGGLAGGFQNGGVIIVSKWPIEIAREIVFKRGSPEDKHARKGCVYARINKNGFIYNIFGTHPEAVDRSIRKEQLETIAKFIKMQNIPSYEPVIIAGDMNVDRYDTQREYDNMLQYLQAKDPWPGKGERYSADYNKNMLNILQLMAQDPKDLKHAEYPKNLDYILYSSAHAQPLKATSEVRIPTSKPYRFDDLNLDVYVLSDHHAVYGYFNFPCNTKR
jgi:endonuclease/exonuclease/phosphatase family metal-dependent hydrolase